MTVGELPPSLIWLLMRRGVGHNLKKEVGQLRAEGELLKKELAAAKRSLPTEHPLVNLRGEYADGESDG